MRYLFVLPCFLLLSCAGQPSAVPGSTTPPPAAPHIDVNQVLDQLKAAGATDPIVSTPDTDPNHLLGRSGYYVARATFVLPGGEPERDTVSRGGVVEIWESDGKALARSQIVQQILHEGGGTLGSEVHFRHDGVLVRVRGDVPQEAVDRIGVAVAGLR